MRGIRKDFNHIFQTLEEADLDSNKSTLLCVYYTGHGAICKGTTHIILNETDATNDRYYPLQQKLKLLSGYRNTFVMAVFDCCRESIVVPGMRGDQ